MNIMIVGVGGQGTLLASRILGKVAIKEGYDVKVSEVHGMSQRGGSVVTYIKYGEKVYSPIIDRGEADLVLAFEMLEQVIDDSVLLVLDVFIFHCLVCFSFDSAKIERISELAKEKMLNIVNRKKKSNGT